MPRTRTSPPLLRRLREGNRRFVGGRSVHPRQTPARLHAQAAGQRPFVTVLGCSDSRVPVEEVFDMGVGDVFACRLAGNLATTEVIASVEYSVAALGVPLVLVLGHSGCGAVHAAMTPEPHAGFIESLVNNMELAMERAGAEAGDPDVVCKCNVRVQMERLSRSKILREAGTHIVGAMYDLATGRVAFDV